MPHLSQLPAGTRFRLADPELPLTGMLLAVNECRARVRLDRSIELVEFTGRDGQARSFRAVRNVETSWTPAVSVEVLSTEPLIERDTTMATTKKTAKKAPAKKATKAAGAKPAKAKQQRAPKAGGKLSQIDAAAKVLAEAGEPMTTRAMVEAMGAKGYWQSPGGKTPHATLYSALTRDIQNKGPESRFAKADRGQFTLNTPSAKPSTKGRTTRKRTTKQANAKPADGTPGPKAVSELFKV
jgi:hypothetical protein